MQEILSKDIASSTGGTGVRLDGALRTVQAVGIERDLERRAPPATVDIARLVEMCWLENAESFITPQKKQHTPT